MARTIYEVVLRAPSEADPAGRVVEMKEMGTEDLLKSFELAGQGTNAQSANLRTKLMALRLCIVKDGDTVLTYSDLIGPKWDERFTLRETTLLIGVWGKVHEPSAEDAAGLGGLVRAKSGG